MSVKLKVLSSLSGKVKQDFTMNIMSLFFLLLTMILTFSTLYAPQSILPSLVQ